MPLPQTLPSPTKVAHAQAAYRQRRLLIPAALLFIFFLQSAWFINTQGITTDEPSHIEAGLSIWEFGRFTIFQDHPPLARKILSAPLYYFTKDTVDLMRWNAEATPVGFTPDHLRWPRYAVMLMGLTLGGALWMVVASLFSDAAASFALAMFCFSPAVIAHFSLATTDGAGTLSLFLAAVAFAMWVNDPSWKRGLLLAFAVGFMCVTKFSNVPIAGMIGALMCFQACRRRQIRPLKQLLMVTAISWLIICFAYNFHVGRFTFTNGTMVAHFQHSDNDWVAQVPFHASFTVYVPGGDFLNGLGTIYRHNRNGHGHSYLFGEIAPTYRGFRSYFLWAVLLKWPTIVLLLSLAGAVIVARGKLPLSRGFCMAAALPIIFYLLALNANIQIGERHILPVYPFALLAAAAVWQHFRNSRTALVALAMLAVLNAADVMRYAPDYLSYFPVFIRQAETWKYFGGSNLDWGQGLLAVKKYQDAHPNETLYLRNTGGLDPSFYGIRYQHFAEDERPHGTVVIFANELTGTHNRDQYALRWLLDHPVKAYLNHSVFVFQVD